MSFTIRKPKNKASAFRKRVISVEDEDDDGLPETNGVIAASTRAKSRSGKMGVKAGAGAILYNENAGDVDMEEFSESPRIGEQVIINDIDGSLVADSPIDALNKDKFPNVKLKKWDKTRSKHRITALSFDDDDLDGDQATLGTKKPLSSVGKKLGQAPVSRDLYFEERTSGSSSDMTAAVGPASYSRDYLESLKRSQLTKSASISQGLRAEESADDFGTVLNHEELLSLQQRGGSIIIDDDLMDIPDASEIATTKKLREMRKKELGQGSQGDGKEGEDFISLDVSAPNPTSRYGESRLVTEDQDGEHGEEAFEDYDHGRLSFGTQAVKDAEQKQRQEAQTLLIDAQDDDIDEEVEHWEIAQILKGQGKNSANGTVKPKPPPQVVSACGLLQLKFFS